MEGDDKFADRYRIDSTRLPGWNYGDDGYYFITICTKDRVEYFGEVLCDNDGVASVALTDIGKIVRDELLKTPQIRPNVKLDEWIIMPNHIHAIIVIDNSDVRGVPNRRDALHASLDARIGDEYLRVEGDASIASLQDGEYKNAFGPQRNNLASIVRGYKSAVTMYAIKHNIDFKWQPRYYDRIIPARNATHSVAGGRTERALYAVRRYIIDNPKNWHRDRNNPINLWI